MQAHSAALDDIESVHALLETAGVQVERASLERRLADRDGGIVLASSATISWVMDGAALHLYDIVGLPDQLLVLLRLITTIAHEQLAVVLVATLYADDPMTAVLEKAGFARDWEEADVREGRVRSLFTFLHMLEEE